MFHGTLCDQPKNSRDKNLIIVALEGTGKHYLSRPSLPRLERDFCVQFISEAYLKRDSTNCIT